MIKKKLRGISRVLVGLKIMKGVTQLCGVSRGEALFYLEFPRVK